MQNIINKLQPMLVGKTIESIRYMSEEEMTRFMWDSRPLIIILNDGTFLIPQRDDEGNDAGAIALINKSDYVLIPTI